MAALAFALGVRRLTHHAARVVHGLEVRVVAYLKGRGFEDQRLARESAVVLVAVAIVLEEDALRLHLVVGVVVGVFVIWAGLLFGASGFRLYLGYNLMFRRVLTVNRYYLVVALQHKVSELVRINLKVARHGDSLAQEVKGLLREQGGKLFGFFVAVLLLFGGELVGDALVLAVGLFVEQLQARLNFEYCAHVLPQLDLVLSQQVLALFVQFRKAFAAGIREFVDESAGALYLAALALVSLD